MAEMVRYTATKLNGTGKQGKLVADADGYYEYIVGGLNVLNSVGEFYQSAGVVELFDKSSIFKRRIQNGNLKAELGHPKRLPGMSDDDFINRILSIEETNVCAHFKDIWLDLDFGKNHPEYKNRNLVAIMALVKPAGEKGPALAKSFENPSENVNFSIRSLTKDFNVGMMRHRMIRTIITFDCVTEPGIHIANKWDSPALETYSDEYFSIRQVSDSVNRMVRDPIAVESSKLLATETLLAIQEPKIALPLYRKW
jgi:hypothetical protein